ncbi:hypothetical protein [Nocardioides litoris]|uniref:hypothetical protein n=1 Tax=Nocardioides litoris TaxID=1926648 RepID=UPI0011211713|nr:hypothetical protein [Nocardioides litoris]
MTAVIVTMTLVLVVAAAALAFAAWPHRGEPLPVAPWLSDLVERAAVAVPTLREDDGPDGPTGAPGEQGPAGRGVPGLGEQDRTAAR